ncbi:MULTISPECIES: hypothetical protein [unclassified Kitasatospora]|uniref:hypothetical protein n=1 Tax=unclassified Kitasatospora TaxID=2633591 RepID=UPI00340F3948
MAVREDTARDVRHEPERHGRHGRPRPFGGRLRLPTLRFSGAAMAMSTVVGISIATTLLLNEQQGIGRRAGVARVGSTPPPTPGATDQAEAASAQTPTATPAGGPSATRQPAHPSTRPAAHPSGAAPVLATPPGDRSAHPGSSAPTGGQTTTGQDSQPPGTQLAGTQPGVPAPAGPSPAAPTPPAGQPDGQPTDGAPPKLPGIRPTAPTRPVPPPTETAPGTGGSPDGQAPTDPGGDGGTPTDTPGPTAPAPTAPGPGTPDPSTDHALSGISLVAPLGRDGLRHELGLTVTEPVTALQAEFRLAPGESAAGTGTAWTDLPGAVVTVQQERGTLVYRFTTPPGTDVRPGHYTFGARGARPAAADPSAVRKSAPAESWSASAFALDHPRAVAALGGFDPIPPLPTPAPPTPSLPAAPPPFAPQAPGVPAAPAPR